MNNQVIVLEGEVLENLPNTQFMVRVKESEIIIRCYLSGKMRKNFIKILPGDKVRFEVRQNDMSMGRIIYRQ
ncbi:MAG: translation initiation factor IF-1 [Patescibacteria group bacterium]